MTEGNIGGRFTVVDKNIGETNFSSWSSDTSVRRSRGNSYSAVGSVLVLSWLVVLSIRRHSISKT